jgi:hypothetical protein
MENLLKSAYGTVRPYTRHATGCTHHSDDNSCVCPKWLYVFSTATKEKRRYTLNTPSWAEALREASDALRGLDPEIAASRGKVQDTPTPLTVHEAMRLWVARTENKLGKDASTIGQYRHLEELVSEWARANNIKYAKDITSHQLEKWYASQEWTRLAPTTRKQRWAVLRVMFAHMVRVKAISESPADPIEAANVTSDHVQGPYTDTQVKAILAHVEYAPQTVTDRAGLCDAAARFHPGSCWTPAAIHNYREKNSRTETRIARAEQPSPASLSSTGCREDRSRGPHPAESAIRPGAIQNIYDNSRPSVFASPTPAPGPSPTGTRTPEISISNTFLLN